MKARTIAVSFVGALALLANMDSALAQGPVFTFRAEGDFASLSWFLRTATGYKRLFIFVSKSENTNNGQTFLIYDRGELADGVWTTRYGYGLIPNSAFTTDNGGQKATLSIDLGELPEFNHFQYVIESGCPTTMPTDPPDDGRVFLTWQRDQVSWSRSEGHTLQQIGDYVAHSQGTSASFSATVEGSAFGETTAGGFLFPTVGSNHQVFMTVERGQ